MASSTWPNGPSDPGWPAFATGRSGRCPASSPPGGPWAPSATGTRPPGRLRPITWDTDSAADWLADPGLYAYLAEDGFLAYRWQRGNQDLYAQRPAAISARTVRALWTQLPSPPAAFAAIPYMLDAF